MRNALQLWSIVVFGIIAMFATALMPSQAECGTSGKGKVIEVVEKGKEFESCKSVPVPIIVVEGTMPSNLKPGKRVILKSKSTGKTTAEVLAVYKDQKQIDNLTKAEQEQEVVVIWKDKDDKGVAILLPSKPFMPEKGAKVKLKAKRPRKVEGC